MVLRVRPTPTRFPTNSLYAPVDKHTLAFYIKCVPPVGRGSVVRAFCDCSDFYEAPIFRDLGSLKGNVKHSGKYRGNVGAKGVEGLREKSIRSSTLMKV